MKEVIPLLVFLVFVHTVQGQNLTAVWSYDSGIPYSQFGYDIKTCDVNGDFQTDLVVAGNGTFWVLYGQVATTSFGFPEQIAITNSGLLSVECAEFSSGITDIIIGDPLQNYLHVFRYNSTVEQITAYDSALHSNVTGRIEFGSKLIAADLNEDLILDLVVSDPGAGLITIFLSDVAGSPFMIQMTIGTAQDRFGQEFVVADVVGTTALDIVASAPDFTGTYTSEGRVYVYNGDGSGAFSSPNTTNGNVVQSKLGNIMAADSRQPSEQAFVLMSYITQNFLLVPPSYDFPSAAQKTEFANITALAFLNNFMNNDGTKEVAVAIYNGTHSSLHVYASGNTPQNSIVNFTSWNDVWSIHKITWVVEKSARLVGRVVVTQPSYNNVGRVVLLNAYSWYQTDTAVGDPSPDPTPSISPTPGASSSASPNASGPSASASTSPTVETGSSSTEDNTAVIAGAVAGGGGGCLVIVIGLAFWFRKRKKKDDDSDISDDEDAMEVADM